MRLFSKDGCLLLEYNAHIVWMIQEIGDANGQRQAHDITVPARHLQKKLERIMFHRMRGCPHAGRSWRLSGGMKRGSATSRWGAFLHGSRLPFQKGESFQ
jgi:hypothetical protein